MVIFTERKAEDFLERNLFQIVKRASVDNEENLSIEADKIGFPLVIKASGEKIVHKNRVGGVKTNINNKEDLVKAFNDFKKINGFEGVVLQRQLKGKEFLLGIKKTPEFGHVIVFGAGGIYTEKLKDVSFRVCSFEKKDAEEMIDEVKSAEGLEESLREKIIFNLLKLCNLVKKYPDIKELDINPLIVGEDNAIIVDARIVF